MTSCLSDADLGALLRGDLNNEQRSRFELHLRACPSCQGRAASISTPAADASAPIHRSPTEIEVRSPATAAPPVRGDSGWADVDRPDRSSAISPRPAVPLNEFLTSLSQSGLLPAAEIAEIRERSHRDPAASTVAGLIDWLIGEHKLTRYQAEILARGQSGGLVLGNYIIQEKLGQGGMGTVFKARHRRMNRLVALKVLPQALADVPEAIARFQREVEAAARLQHPNIAAAYDADESAGVHFMVMEYVDGPNLAAYVRQRGPLPLGLAVRLIAQAARGLAAAHAQGIVHRDIKPSNIMVTRQGVVKVLDLGLAQVRGHEPQLELTSDVTETGRVMGTVDYMSPEQARDAKNVDLRADIYSLGCTLFFLAAGRPPAPGTSAAEKLLWHQAVDPPPLSTVAPQATPRLEALASRMLAKSPDSRPSSMHDVADELLACAAELPEPSELDLDGVTLAGEPAPSSRAGSSHYGQPTLANLDETLVSAPGRRPAKSPPSPPKTRWLVPVSGIAGSLALGTILAAPYFALPESPKKREEKQPNASDRVPADSEIPAKANSSASPFASRDERYLPLLETVFRHGGEVRVETPVGNLPLLNSLDELPDQAVRIVEIHLDRSGVRNDDLAVLQLAPELEALSLAETPITDAGLVHLLPLANLRRLTLSKTNVTSQGLAPLARLHSLRTLNLQGARLSDEGLSLLCGLPELEVLILIDNPDLSDVGAAQLSGMKSLTFLALHGTALSESGFQALEQSLPGVQIAWDGADVPRAAALHLLAKGAIVTVAGPAVAAPVEIRSADDLPAGRLAVRAIDLTGATAEFGDGDLVHLAALPEIERLTLPGSRLTAAGLKQLAALTSLKSLDLGTMRLPPETLKALESELPGCKIAVREPADVEVARRVIQAGGRVVVEPMNGGARIDAAATSRLPAGDYKLRAIDLSEAQRADAALLDQLAELPHLETLILTDLAITDASLRKIASSPSLEHLVLSGTQVSGAGLGELGRLPRLAELYLADVQIGKEGARQIAGLAALKRLSLRNVRLADDDLAPLKRLSRLEWLDLAGTPIGDGALVHLASFDELQHLDLHGTAVTDAGEEHLRTELPGCDVANDPPDPERLAARWLLRNKATVTLDSGPLTSADDLPADACRVLAIDLGQVEGLRRRDVAAQLAACRNVTSLNLTRTGLTDGDVGFLSRMPALSELRLAELSVSDRVLALLKEHERLTLLDLRGTLVTGSGLEYLTQSPGLKQLLLTGPLVERRHLAALASLASLEVLDLSGNSNVRDADMEPIARLTNLRELGLGRTKIGNAAVEKLAQLERLELLDLDGTDVDDDGVRSLAKLPRLQRLILSNTGITSGSASVLAAMKQLRALRLEGTEFSADAIRQLQAALPEAAITAPSARPRDPLPRDRF